MPICFSVQDREDPQREADGRRPNNGERKPHRVTSWRTDDEASRNCSQKWTDERSEDRDNYGCVPARTVLRGGIATVPISNDECDQKRRESRSDLYRLASRQAGVLHRFLSDAVPAGRDSREALILGLRHLTRRSS